MTAVHKDVDTKYSRQLALMHDDLEVISEYLTDDTVSDIMINPDGKLFIRRSLVGRIFTDRIIPQETTKRIIYSVASLIGKTVNTDDPELSGVIPEYACRIHAFIPPVVHAPSICIRKPTARVFTLADYVVGKRLSPAQHEAIYNAVMARENILIGGGTGTGKTTLLNAIINEITLYLPEDRLYIVEDTEEIRCTSADYVSLCVPPNKTVNAVRGALRYNPDRIIFGELRYGDTALELLKAWNTGHPGGQATLHSDSARKMLPRLVDLISESVTGNVPHAFLTDTISMCVFLNNIPGFGPKVTDIVRVLPDTHDGRFHYETIPA